MYPNSNDENGNKFEQKWQAMGIPAYTQFAKNWTVGLRYDITPWMMVRAEYDYINGTSWISNEANIDRLPQQHWDMFGFLVSLRF